MQLYLVNWSFQNSEDQLFACNEFCKFVERGKLKEDIDGFELKFIAHTPQNGSGVIICKAQNTRIIFNLLNMWRMSYGISFDIQPALTSEDLIELNGMDDYWQID